MMYKPLLESEFGNKLLIKAGSSKVLNLPHPHQQKNFFADFDELGPWKKNEFGVITHLSTYIGCNNITTFFLFF